MPKPNAYTFDCISDRRGASNRFCEASQWMTKCYTSSLNTLHSGFMARSLRITKCLRTACMILRLSWIEQVTIIAGLGVRNNGGTN